MVPLLLDRSLRRSCNQVLKFDCRTRLTKDPKSENVAVKYCCRSGTYRNSRQPRDQSRWKRKNIWAITNNKRDTRLRDGLAWLRARLRVTARKVFREPCVISRLRQVPGSIRAVPGRCPRRYAGLVPDARHSTDAATSVTNTCMQALPIADLCVFRTSQAVLSTAAELSPGCSF